MVVIKADGYGHGAVPVAKYVDEIADAYGVAIAREGAQLRRVGITKPILVLGWTHPQDNDILIENDITQTVFTYDMAKKLSECASAKGKRVKIHIKLVYLLISHQPILF
jgi:alanine racemase